MLTLATTGTAWLSVAAGTATGNVPVWLYMIVTVLGTGVVGRVLFWRHEHRQRDAEASHTEADTEHIRAETEQAKAETAQNWQTVYEKTIDAFEERVAAMEREMSQLRDHARSAEAAAKEAQADAAKFRAAAATADARLAKVQAELAATIARASEERHALVNDLRGLKLQLDAKDIELAKLRAEFETLRAQLGHVERRRTERRDG